MSAVLDEGRPLARAVAREAARWLAQLHSGEATASDREGCQRWRAADPEHERAWQRAERLSGQLHLLPKAAGLQVLGRPRRTDRRAAVKTLVVLLTAAPMGYGAWREWGHHGAADHRTAVGERREVMLPDGSRVFLNTATAVDVRFDAAVRRVVLRDGEVLVETRPDPSGRPFVVETAAGATHALGTRFVVRHSAGEGVTRVAVLEHAVVVTPVAGAGGPVRVDAGRRTRFTATSVDTVVAADLHVADWSRGVLFADGMRLADFAAELGRHRRGLLRVDPAVADLRLTGAFQLDRLDAVLAALPDTLPVTVFQRTRWWVTLGPAGAPHPH